MATEIKLPELGENLEGGEVLDVKVAAGDTVTEGQTLLEVEAEKSTVEVPSPLAGRVAKLMVKKGDSIKVGQTLCLIEGKNGAEAKGSKEAPAHVSEKAEPEPVPAARREPVEEPVEEAVAQTARTETDGRRGESAKTAPAPSKDDTAVLAGPATRRLARELGVDLHQVPASDPTGRVSAEDIKAYVRQLTADGARSRPGKEAPPLPDFERWGPVDRQPVEPIRRRTAQLVSLSWNQVPHVAQHDLADITELDAFRRQQEGRGPKLTITAFALKAAAIALREYPRVNSSLDFAAGQLVLKRYYHIGVAVDTEHGLLVPVVRDVDRKSVAELAQELIDVAERARQKKLQADEMRGGTFTITNLGGIGGTGFSPIVNYPEVAILGLSRARLQPVVRDGQIVPRLLLPLSLSYDHRVIDGAAAARFTRRIGEMLEDPLLMLLQA